MYTDTAEVRMPFWKIARPFLAPVTRFCGILSVATRRAEVGGAGHIHLEWVPGDAPVEKDTTGTVNDAFTY